MNRKQRRTTASKSRKPAAKVNHRLLAPGDTALVFRANNVIEVVTPAHIKDEAIGFPVRVLVGLAEILTDEDGTEPTPSKVLSDQADAAFVKAAEKGDLSWLLHKPAIN